jgi:hypothetical protein
MKIKKSTRHSKLTGDFSEHLVMYWLSKYGFECARVDHTGIDLIACNLKTKVRMGISVKSRCRYEGKEGQGVRVDVKGMNSARKACRDFGCEPFLAIVVDAGDRMRCFILPFDTFYKLYPGAKKRNVNWSMREKWRARYDGIPDIKRFELTSATGHWWY